MYQSMYMSCFALLLASGAFGQSEIIRSDFNNDGIPDSILLFSDAGSGFASTTAAYIDGRTKQKAELSMLHSFGSFFSVSPVPAIVGEKGMEQVGIFLFNKHDSIDPSLHWLIDACSNKREIPGDQPADFAGSYTPVWTIGELVIPQKYFALLHATTYAAFLRNVTYDDPAGSTKTGFFWIAYYPFNHHPGREKSLSAADSPRFSSVQTTGSKTVYTSAHAVILKTGNRYSWIFINDNQLFEANEKLRWPSVGEVLVLDNYVLIQQRVNTGGTNLFIVNPDAGQFIRLNKSMTGLQSIDNIKTDRQKQSIELEETTGKKYALPLSSVKEIFRKLFPG